MNPLRIRPRRVINWILALPLLPVNFILLVFLGRIVVLDDPDEDQDKWNDWVLLLILCVCVMLIVLI